VWRDDKGREIDALTIENQIANQLFDSRYDIDAIQTLVQGGQWDNLVLLLRKLETRVTKPLDSYAIADSLVRLLNQPGSILANLKSHVINQHKVYDDRVMSAIYLHAGHLYRRGDEPKKALEMYLKAQTYAKLYRDEYHGKLSEALDTLCLAYLTLQSAEKPTPAFRTLFQQVFSAKRGKRNEIVLLLKTKNTEFELKEFSGEVDGDLKDLLGLS
jgi:hypothetical protein